MTKTSDYPSHKQIIDKAEAAVKHAQDVRTYHRKRTKIGHAQRDVDIQHATRQVREAMRPLRASLGRAPYRPINKTSIRETQELRDMSRRVQAERRKLWKLRGGTMEARRKYRP